MEYAMSKMSTLHILICDRLGRGEEPVDIAYALDIPVSWVFEAQESQVVEDCGPFATINSWPIIHFAIQYRLSKQISPALTERQHHERYPHRNFPPSPQIYYDCI